MAFYCINTEPIQEEIPENMRYIFITKDYPKPTPNDGKKKCTKEQIKQYNEMMGKRKTMFDMLDSGHYDIGNAMIKVEPFANGLSGFIGTESDYIYKIKPINACKQYRSSYSRNEDFFVSKFDVEKRIDTVYELIDDLSNSIYYADLFHYIFDRGHYNNEGYRKYAIGLFEYAKKNYPDKKIYLSDCIRRVLHSYDHDGRYNNEPRIEEYVQILLDNSYIELTQDWDYQHDTVKNLIRANWFNIAKDYILAIPDDLRDSYLSDVKKDEYTMNILRANSDKDVVKEIVSLLKVEDMCVVLKVIKYCEWFDEEEIKETKTFKDMNEVRSYVIREYGVPFEDAIKNIGQWRGKDDETFKIS